MKMPTYEELLDELEKHRSECSVEMLTEDMIRMIIIGREKKPPVSFPQMTKILRRMYNLKLKQRSLENFYKSHKDKWLELYGNGLK